MKTFFSRSPFIVISAIALLGVNHSFGEIVTFSFAGQVTYIGNPLGVVVPALIHLGSPVQASIRYDTATPDSPLYIDDPTWGSFVGPGAVKVNINGLKFEQDNTIQVDILHGANGGQELFQAGGYRNPTAWPSELPVLTNPTIFMAFWETGPPRDLLANAELPTLMDFSRADITHAFVRSSSAQSGYEIQFSLVQVPEPTSAGLLAIGLLCFLPHFTKKSKHRAS